MTTLLEHTIDIFPKWIYAVTVTANPTVTVVKADTTQCSGTLELSGLFTGSAGSTVRYYSDNAGANEITSTVTAPPANHASSLHDIFTKYLICPLPQ